jgi:hypothetical protein
VTVKYLRDQRHVGTVAEIAKVKFPFPNEETPDMETLLNIPKQVISVGQFEGRDLYPDIVVVGRPGQWLRIMAEVEMEDSVTSESALTDWLPMSLVGDLVIYVPAGMASEAKHLCKKHGVKPKGIRTWRFRPVWGLDVADA